MVDSLLPMLAQQGPTGAVLAILLFVHAKHVTRLGDSVDAIAKSLERLVAKSEVKNG